MLTSRKAMVVPASNSARGKHTLLGKIDVQQGRFWKRTSLSVSVLLI